MYTKFALVVSGFFLLTFTANAQVDPDAIGYYTDALRFSQNTPGGTARFQGIGGVNNALGADLSSLAGNPAGMGFYQRSEIGISTGFGFGSTQSNALNNTQKDHRDYFSFPNLGLVFAARKDETETGVFRGGAFGIGLTRIQNFQNQFSYSGTNTKNSMRDYLLETTAAQYPDPLALDEMKEEDYDIPAIAYYAFLTNPPDALHSGYWTMDQEVPVKQEETVKTRGALNQWNFAYGGNFNDKIYLGASLGVPVIRYLTEKTYREELIGSDSLLKFRFSENLKTTGTGVNLKIGAIFKPDDWIRVGVSLQTPTYYSIKEAYQYSIKANFNDLGGVPNEEESQTTPRGEYKYNLITPFKASAGLALFAGKAGFIAADIEYVPYSHASLKESSVYSTADKSTFTGDNRTIQNIYKPAVNINIGGELRHDVFRFRAGYALQGDPYNNVDNVNRKVRNISGGAGVRLENYYFDIALVNSHYRSIYKSYTLNNGEAPEAKVKNSNTTFIMSAGLFF